MSEEGLLDLDDSVEFYLEQDIVDSISIIDGQSYGFLITVRMLLSHRSGVNDFADESFYNGLYANPGRYWNPEDLVRYAIRMGDALFIPDLIPANEYSYSNTNYILLGMIIEERTGRQFHQVLRERIYSRVGMADTYLAERQNIPPVIASGYDGDNDVSSFNYSFEWANAGIVSTTEDIHKFLNALMNGQLFSSSLTLSEMENPNGYGLGLQATVTTSGILGYGHFGESLGFVSFMMYLPSSNSYLVAAMNQRLGDEEGLYLDLLSVIE
jgi:D-alanyl-D-alanine carboxypeptidase